MGLGHSPQIVTNGMVLCLDAANPKNYNLTEVEVLVVAGGGAGGGYHGGGGGAGGLIYNSNFAVTPGTQLTAIVGDGGGAPNSSSNTGNPGGNSQFGSLIAYGGGAGISQGYEAQARNNGGSGGGGCDGSNAVNHPGGSGTSGQGFKGGDVYGDGSQLAIYYGTAGGGGAGGAGGAGGVINGGFGGSGLPFSISGTLTYYAGGGGGTHLGSSSITNYGIGGLGGGGTGGISPYPHISAFRSSTSGSPNTGGGGGGHLYSSLGGGAGGSGIIIVRYPGSQRAIGGTITSNNGYTIHTFTTSGTFTPLVATNNSAILGLSDLSGRGNFVTTANSPTYSSANGGSVSFDGSNEYVTITSTGIVTNNISVDIWFNVNSAKTYTGLLGSNATEKYEMLIKTASNLEISLSPGNFIQHNNILSINTWTNIVVSASNGVAWKVYKNGVDLGTPSIIVGSYQISGTGVSNIDQGRIRNDVGSFAFSGNIASTKIYNRALTQAEVSQNFNALRGRFGI